MIDDGLSSCRGALSEVELFIVHDPSKIPASKMRLK